MRIKELRDSTEGPKEEREEASGEGRGEVVTVARLRAKRALFGAGARVLFYSTLLYHVLRNRFEVEFRWCNSQSMSGILILWFDITTGAKQLPELYLSIMCSFA
ncbi:hypothetical protein GUJ93_ZPchr0008g13044 [Zizania palustris]|uniref:Uncharacterized protein n=1 Tax=Zizania palustris TaxID=103762 RepID=A0A8J5VG41_ZIZPA|nr:hypothetical protein GUJ93_ZPchr0008g13044 [Zizania palustris]